MNTTNRRSRSRKRKEKKKRKKKKKITYPSLSAARTFIINVIRLSSFNLFVIFIFHPTEDI